MRASYFCGSGAPASSQKRAFGRLALRCSSFSTQTVSVGLRTVYFGGGSAPLVLKWSSANSTQTLFLHREERVESGGYEFNTEAVGGN